MSESGTLTGPRAPVIVTGPVRPQLRTRTLETYNRGEFYQGNSRDKKGFSTTIRVSISPDIMREIQTMVEGKGFPYTTKADFVRDAMLHRLHDLAELSGDPGMQDRVRGLRHKELVMKAVNQRKEFDEFLEGVKEHMKECRDPRELERVKDECLVYAKTLGSGYYARMIGELKGLRSVG